MRTDTFKFKNSIGEWIELALKDYVDLSLQEKIEDAPVDTKQYARKDGDWEEVVVPDLSTIMHYGNTTPSASALLWSYETE